MASPAGSARRAFPAHRFVAVAAVACACGPSLTTVHEGSIRFEHCNRLDLDPSIVKRECGECWSTWLASYTYGQPRDRIDYARRRARALANGDSERPVLSLGEHRPEERQFYLVVPGPTSGHTPPPPIATVWQSTDAGVLGKSAPEQPPAESCAESCRSAWQSCTNTCSPDAGAKAGASSCAACKDEYSGCMRHCFE